MSKTVAKTAPKARPTVAEIDEKLAAAKAQRAEVEVLAGMAAFDALSDPDAPQADKLVDELNAKLVQLSREIALLETAKEPARQHEAALAKQARDAIWKGKRESTRGFLARRDATAKELEDGLKNVCNLWRQLLELNGKVISAAPANPVINWNGMLVGSEPIDQAIRTELWRLSGGLGKIGFPGNKNYNLAGRSNPAPDMLSFSQEVARASQVVLAQIDGATVKHTPVELVQSPAAVPHQLAHIEGGRETTWTPSLVAVGTTPKGTDPNDIL